MQANTGETGRKSVYIFTTLTRFICLVMPILVWTACQKQEVKSPPNKELTTADDGTTQRKKELIDLAEKLEAAHQTLNESREDLKRKSGELEEAKAAVLLEFHYLLHRGPTPGFYEMFPEERGRRAAPYFSGPRWL